jgi:deoxyadenosine/deoxycytidine kinase
VPDVTLQHNPQNNQFIAIAGNIGAGKSTLTTMLADAFGWQPFLEGHTENPYLADFYGDMGRWSFHSQLFFMGKRLEHHRLLTDYPGWVIQDRTVYEDAEIFARNLYRQGHMAQRDWETYQNLYTAVTAFLPHPTLVIYLRASTPTLLRQIARRGRDYEKRISPTYVDGLNELYEDWAHHWSLSPLVTLEMDGLDFQHRPSDFAHVCDQIRAAAPVG